MLRLLLALVLVFPLSAHAESKKGHEMLELCNATQIDPSTRSKAQKQADHLSIIACDKYLAGVSDLNKAAGMPYNREGIFFCPTANMTMKKMTAIYVRYLQAHPEKLDVNAALLAVAAFKNAFPCNYQNYLDRR